VNSIRPKLKLPGLVAWFACAKTFLAQTPSASKADTGDALPLTLGGKVEVAPAVATAWPPAQTNPALSVGDRSYHRAAEVWLGLLNLGNQDGRLNRLNLCNELPRERTLSVMFKFYF